MTGDTERLERLKAERAAAGLPELIWSEQLQRMVAAVLASARERQRKVKAAEK